jgi:acyl-ACP thioesterase
MKYEDIKVWEKELKIPLSDVDFRGKIKLNSIFGIMQNEALNHSERIGVGFNKFLNDGQIWVLTWAKIIIEKYPDFEDTILLRTWLKKQHKLFTIRDFLFIDKQNIPIIKASTGWLLLNAKTKRPERPKSLPQTVTFLENLNSINEMPRKIKDSENLIKVFEKKIYYADLDPNIHTNNSKYMEFILNSFPIETYENKEIKEMTLFFLSDARYGDIIEIFFKKEITENKDYIKIINKTTGNQILRVILDWENIN